MDGEQTSLADSIGVRTRESDRDPFGCMPCQQIVKSLSQVRPSLATKSPLNPAHAEAEFLAEWVAVSYCAPAEESTRSSRPAHLAKLVRTNILMNQCRDGSLQIFVQAIRSDCESYDSWAEYEGIRRYAIIQALSPALHCRQRLT